MADQAWLFPNIEFGEAHTPNGGCAAPIGRQRLRRPRVRRSKRPSPVAALLHELHRLLERQHSELMAEVGRLRQQRRNEYEGVQPMLRRLTEIERHLRLTEAPSAPKPSRRHPLDA